LKIGIVTEYYYPLLGGITENVHHTRIRLAALGHDVKIITTTCDGGMFRRRKSRDVVDPNILRIGRSLPVISNGSFAHFSVGSRLSAKISSIFYEEKFDLIHVHSPLTPTLPLIAVRKARCPVVATFHTYFEKSLICSLLKKIMQEQVVNKLDGQIAVSKCCIDALTRYFELKATVISNGVDINQFNPSQAGIPIFEDGKKNLLFVGRFDLRNGLGTMLRAFSRIKAAYPNVRLIVVGDGPLRPYYKSMAPKALSDDIQFVGLVRDMRPNFYASCDVFCSPISKASFGVTLLEAMASSKPIVATENVGYKELLSPAEGIMVPHGDIDAFAKATIRLLEDESLAGQLGENGRQKAVGYSWDGIVPKLVDFYNQILNRQ
jgi:phosphatidylinositol alpha-mannosyltransferase